MCMTVKRQVDGDKSILASQVLFEKSKRGCLLAIAMQANDHLRPMTEIYKLKKRGLVRQYSRMHRLPVDTANLYHQFLKNEVIRVSPVAVASFI